MTMLLKETMRIAIIVLCGMVLVASIFAQGKSLAAETITETYTVTFEARDKDGKPIREDDFRQYLRDIPNPRNGDEKFQKDESGKKYLIESLEISNFAPIVKKDGEQNPVDSGSICAKIGDKVTFKINLTNEPNFSYMVDYDETFERTGFRRVLRGFLNILRGHWERINENYTDNLTDQIFDGGSFRLFEHYAPEITLSDKKEPPTKIESQSVCLVMPRTAEMIFSLQHNFFTRFEELGQDAYPEEIKRFVYNFGSKTTNWTGKKIKSRSNLHNVRKIPILDPPKLTITVVIERTGWPSDSK